MKRRKADELAALLHTDCTAHGAGYSPLSHFSSGTSFHRRQRAIERSSAIHAKKISAPI